jgi:Trk K+ transport system NAD-binding subunit
MPLYPPRGRWILCGYGRFGKAVHQGLRREGVTTVIIEEDPEGTGCNSDCVRGRGTEADTLQQAGIAGAVGIVAGTNHDTNNLSILMTAHELNPDLFMVGRQNKDDNGALFAAGHVDLVMRHSEILAEAVLAHLTSPLLPLFLKLARERDDDWANELVSRIGAVTDDRVPELWSAHLTTGAAPALLQRLRSGTLSLGQLLVDPGRRDQQVPCVALLLERGNGGEKLVTPGDEVSLHPGDRILFSGQSSAASRINRALRNPHHLEFLITGKDQPQGSIWRHIAQRGA